MHVMLNTYIYREIGRERQDIEEEDCMKDIIFCVQEI